MPSTWCPAPTPSHFLDWTAKNWVEPYVTEDMAKHFPREQVDPNGMHATLCAWLEVIGYNTDLVKREDAPKSYADLLDPKWQGKIVKAHPGYSGAILTNTYLLGARARLALSGKIGAAESHAGAVGRRSAEENRASASAR